LSDDGEFRRSNRLLAGRRTEFLEEEKEAPSDVVEIVIILLCPQRIFINFMEQWDDETMLEQRDLLVDME
jgi:hypothetical protein